MPTDLELSQIADALLAEFPRESVRVYSESAFEAKLRRARERKYRRREVESEAEDKTYLLRNCLAAVVLRAGLTDRQKEILLMRFRGDGVTEIARQLGVSKQSIARCFEYAIAKLRRTWRSDAYADLHEVYWQEVTRFSNGNLGR